MALISSLCLCVLVIQVNPLCACSHGDGVAERLARLEARQRTLEEDGASLKRESLHLNVDANKQLDIVQGQMQGNQQKKEQASFQTQLSPFQKIFNGGDVLQFSDVISNDGDHFNASTGYFTAPYEGSYVFLVSVASADYFTSVDVQLKSDATVIARAYAPRTALNVSMASSCQGLVDLNPGQRVWVECFLMSDKCSLWASATSFAGFLLQKGE